MEHHPDISVLVCAIEFHEREDQNCHSMIYAQHWRTNSHSVCQHSMHWPDVIPLARSLPNLQHWRYKNLSLIHSFNSSALTQSMIQMEETFLVKCLKPTTDVETFDLLSLMALPSKRTSIKPHSPESRQENTSKEHVINNRCGYKPHLEMPP